jgi:predicted nucleic-acid-binding protein
MECEWVLRSVYRLDRRVIHDSLQRFTNLAQVVIEAEPCLQRILNLYSEGLDFADAVHLVAARGHATAFASFDSSLAQRANAISVKPPVVAP